MAACLYALGFPLSRGICGHSQEDCPLSEVMMLIMFVIMIETMDIPRVCYNDNEYSASSIFAKSMLRQLQ